MPDEIINNESLYSPYMAAQEGLDEQQIQEFFEKFSRQSADVRAFITSMDVYTAIQDLIAEGNIPPQFRTAIAKIIAFLAMNDVQAGQLPQVLEKLGLQTSAASAAISGIRKIMKPLQERLSGIQTPEDLKELPPLTQKIPEQVPPAPVTQSQSKNVVDLRKQQQP